LKYISRMKKFFYTAILFIFLCAFSFTHLTPVDTKDSVTFVIKNFGIATKGEFTGLKGTIDWDAANPAASSFNISIDAKTINTAVDMRDKELQQENYFFTEKYPLITFVSTSVTAQTVTGNLNIKGISKQIAIPFTVKPSGKGYIFTGNFSINRRDF